MRDPASKIKHGRKCNLWVHKGMNEKVVNVRVSGKNDTNKFNNGNYFKTTTAIATATATKQQHE